MLLNLLAHAGHDHAEQAAHSGITLSLSVLFWVALLVVPAGIFLLSHLLAKAQLATTLLLISVFLIIFSIVSYQQPGVYSVISISVGFATVLLLSMVGLSATTGE